MKASLCLLIVCLQSFAVHTTEHFSKLRTKSLCVEKPSTELGVLRNERSDFVEVRNDKTDSEAKILFHDEGHVTIKNALKSYGNRAFSDFMPYRMNVSEKSSVTSNSSTFEYKRYSKPEDQIFEVSFYKGFYLGSMKDKDFYQLLGLSQQWVGCPQPICLYGTIDAAFYHAKEVYITRGPYYWNLNEGPPTSDKAKLLKDLIFGVVEVIDSAVSLGKYILYFKEKRVYCWIWGSGKTKGLCPDFTKENSVEDNNDLPTFFSVEAAKAFTPELCEASFTFSDQENAKVAIFGENELRKLAIFKLRSPSKKGEWYINDKVIDFPLLFQRKIDAMVNVDNTITIFMGWNNYKVPLSAFESSADIDNKKSASFVSFEDPFKCPKDIYKEWVYDYDKYAEEMNQIVQTEVPKADYQRRIDILESETRVGTVKQSEEQSALPFILIAILLAVIIIVIIVILTEKKRRSKKKPPKEDKPEEVDLRAPAMGSNLDLRSVMGSEILENEYRPGKNIPSSKLDVAKSSSTVSVGESKSKLSNLGSRTSNIDAPMNRRFDSKIFAGKKKKSTKKK